MTEEIRKALQKAGLGHMEDDVLLELGLIEANLLANTIADRIKKEASNGKERNESRVSDSETGR